MHTLSKFSLTRVGLALALAASVALGALALTTQDASAHADPAACNGSAIQQTPFIVSPAGSAYDGDTITYAVSYSNLDPDGVGPSAPCNITLADATIALPD